MNLDQLKELKKVISSYTDIKPEFIANDEETDLLLNPFAFCEIENDEYLLKLWLSIIMVSLDAAKLTLALQEWCYDNDYLFVLMEPVFYECEDGELVFGKEAKQFYQEEFWKNVEEESTSLIKTLKDNNKVIAEC